MPPRPLIIKVRKRLINTRDVLQALSCHLLLPVFTQCSRLGNTIATVPKAKDKRKREARGDPSDIDNYLGECDNFLGILTKSMEVKVEI